MLLLQRLKRTGAELRTLRSHQRRLGLKVGTAAFLREAIEAGDATSVQQLREEVAELARSARTAPPAASERVSLPPEVDARLERLELHAQIPSTTAFVEAAGAHLGTLVSVVLPTHDRPELLRRAIESVRVQTHASWELLVVDTTGDGAAEKVVAAFGDDRVEVLAAPGAGAAAARNVGLGAARGPLVAYLDDDNVMQPSWLRAVAWGFDRWPETTVLYGARIYPSSDHLIGDGRDVPAIQLEPWDRRALQRGNLVDTGVLAHRAGLDAARWDEQLDTCSDWDLVGRLTVDRPPSVLPVVACAYTDDAPDRLSTRASQPDDRREVMRRLRVLGYCGSSPSTTSTRPGRPAGALD